MAKKKTVRRVRAKKVKATFKAVRRVRPFGIKATVKAWMTVRFCSPREGDTVDKVGENISYVAYVRAGMYRVVFNTPMNGLRYAVVVSMSDPGIVSYNKNEPKFLDLYITDLKGVALAPAEISMLIYDI